MKVELEALAGLPEVAAGDDLAELIAAAEPRIENGDIVVVAQKIVSKAEGRAVDLATVLPGDAAVQLAQQTEKDPRLVQLILDESETVLRSRPGVIIVATRQGFVCANAGIDASNVPGDDSVLLLPEDSDASARRLRSRLSELSGARVGVVISDSFGRAWRIGQQDVAIGCAGLEPAQDLRGGSDREGRELTASIAASADEIASAANLSRAKTSGEPVVLVRGLADLVTVEDGPGATALIRARNEDFFR
jgi:coenzyme F420-0:L-glutamate ligase/coenzyme F420-1:gamma-L-glutamate ligase